MDKSFAGVSFPFLLLWLPGQPGHTQGPLIELPDFAELEQTFLLPLRPQPPPPSLLLTPPETALIEKLLMSLGCLWQGGILEALLRLLAT